MQEQRPIVHPNVKIETGVRFNVAKGISEKYYVITNGNHKFYFDFEELKELKLQIELQLLIEKAENAKS